MATTTGRVSLREMKRLARKKARRGERLSSDEARNHQVRTDNSQSNNFVGSQSTDNQALRELVGFMYPSSHPEIDRLGKPGAGDCNP